MSELKKLPIGIQTFEKIITNNYIYVDKTRYLYELIQGGTVYFLARPRRFGKSLTISTLKAIFEGKRELFTGLAIDQLDYDWQKYPVIRLSMPGLSSTDDVASFKNKIKNDLEMAAQELTVSLSSELDPDILLKQLIFNTAKKYSSQVVVLIDEYDKPILDVIEDKSKADSIRSTLGTMYSVLKSLDQNIRFLFLTGVSQFAKTSIFSGLNQLKDISLIKQGQALCGYTDEEIDHYFPEYCKKMLLNNPDLGNVRKNLQIWYDGYKFHHTGPALYNPFSVMNALDIQEFDNYWFSTGTPTFLINLLKECNFSIQNIDSMEIDRYQLTELDTEHPQLLPLLYQTGYATIESYHSPSQIYKLCIPNKEAHQSLLSLL